MHLVMILLCSLSTVQMMQAYALNEAVLPLMGDDRLYNITPVAMIDPVAAVQLATGEPEVAQSHALDVTITGTRATAIPLGKNKKINFSK